MNGEGDDLNIPQVGVKECYSQLERYPVNMSPSAIIWVLLPARRIGGSKNLDRTNLVDL